MLCQISVGATKTFNPAFSCTEKQGRSTGLLLTPCFGVLRHLVWESSRSPSPQPKVFLSSFYDVKSCLKCSLFRRPKQKLPSSTAHCYHQCLLRVSVRFMIDCRISWESKFSYGISQEWRQNSVWVWLGILPSHSCLFKAPCKRGDVCHVRISISLGLQAASIGNPADLSFSLSPGPLNG